MLKMKNRLRNLCAAAIKTFGREHQVEMIKEECVELVHALHKLKRYPDDEKRMQNVLNEIADVTIILEQANQIFGRERVEEAIYFKMKKLEKQIDIHGFNGGPNG